MSSNSVVSKIRDSDRLSEEGWAADRLWKQREQHPLDLSLLLSAEALKEFRPEPPFARCGRWRRSSTPALRRSPT